MTVAVWTVGGAGRSTLMGGQGPRTGEQDSKAPFLRVHAGPPLESNIGMANRPPLHAPLPLLTPQKSLMPTLHLTSP